MIKQLLGDLRRTWSLMPAKYRYKYLIVMFIEKSMQSVLSNILMAFIIRDMLNAATNSDADLLEGAVMLALTAVLVVLPLLFIIIYVRERYFYKVRTIIRSNLFAHLISLPIRLFEQEHSGDINARITNDIGTLESVYGQTQSLISALMNGITALIGVFLLDWLFGIIAIFLGLMTLLINTRFARPLREISDRIQAQWGILTERSVDSIQGAAVARIYHLEDMLQARYASQNDAHTYSRFRRGILNILLGMCNKLLEHIKILGVLSFGLYLLFSNYPLDPGTLVAIIMLQMNANTLFSNLGQYITNIQEALAGAARVFELLDSPPEDEGTAEEKQIAEGARKTKGALGDKIVFSDGDVSDMIVIKNLQFSYELKDGEIIDVLHNINMAVPKGGMAALVGPSGGGKSTLVKLLMGFYPIQEGDITIGGQSVTNHSQTDLRQYIAYVPQDAYLFDGTIEENIRYGRTDASHDDIIMAAKAAHIHDFISSQPQAYETLVGERGVKLSGGQRQRIAIARAILKNAPILLLDEATSSLDSESEQLVQDALKTLMNDRTTIAIAHRLSTIEHADEIYVMEDGKIVEQGKHSTLNQKNGLYSRLYQLQFK